MSAGEEIHVPDIGEFEQVEVIEVLVAVGDRIEVEQSLVTLESDKATMEIPSPQAGVVTEVLLAVGDAVSQGDTIVRIGTGEEARAPSPEAVASKTKSESDSDAPVAADATAVGNAAASAVDLPDADIRAEVLVLGAGPGGYTAAFRAADLGKKVVLVERYEALGGVCLNVGCIPSKALLHLADVINEAKAVAKHGVTFGEPEIDPKAIASFKSSVVKKLTTGLAGLAKRRNVEVVTGEGVFEAPHLLCVKGEASETRIAFESAIIATGSSSVALPGVPDDARIMDSTGALELEDIPDRLLVIGGGIIGLEMASVYSALGSRVSVVELLDQLMTGADPDLVKPLEKIIRRRYEAIYTGTRVTGLEALADGIRVSFEGPDAPATDSFDRVLVAVGRRPNGHGIGAEAAGVAVDERGFIAVNEEQRSNVPHIFAIGDLVGEPMLAHKATHQASVAAEVIAGMKVAFEPRTIPSVAYTDPEVAWMGLTEVEAKKQGIATRKASFPWQASGRALGIARSEGHTKLVLDAESGALLGAGIVGPSAGELISELVLAYEMGADVQDIALTIHPHPTLSETIAFAAEMAEGTITDLYIPKREPRVKKSS
jgi:dihydrolipoamide dehydrogenase